MASKAHSKSRRPKTPPDRLNPERTSAQEDALLIATILAGRRPEDGSRMSESSGSVAAGSMAAGSVGCSLSHEAAAACEALVRKYWKVLVGWIRPRVRSTRDAEEIAQDAFIKAFRSLSSLQSPRSFLAWLLRITANLTTDFLRGRRSHVSLDHLGKEGLAAPKSESLASIGVEQEEELARVLDVVATLPEKYHLVLTLRYRAGLSAKDIATLLEEPEGTIRNRVFRALEKTRDILTKPPKS